MGVWGAAQALAFGLGGTLGAVGVDLGRAAGLSVPAAYMLVFALEAGLFVVSARMASRIAGPGRAPPRPADLSTPTAQGGRA